MRIPTAQYGPGRRQLEIWTAAAEQRQLLELRQEEEEEGREEESQEGKEEKVILFQIRGPHGPLIYLEFK